MRGNGGKGRAGRHYPKQKFTITPLYIKVYEFDGQQPWVPLQPHI